MRTRKGKEGKTEFYMRLAYSVLLHEIEDEGEKYWIAEIPELPGCKSHGSSVEEAIKNIEEAKREWIEDSLEQGEEVPAPIDRENFGGRILVRMSRSLHRSLSLVAESERLSLNQLIVTILAKEVGRLSVLTGVEKKLHRIIAKIDDTIEEKGNIFLKGAMGEEKSAMLYEPTPPVVRALELIVDEAVRSRASDIILEPREDRLQVRYSINNELHDVLSLPISTHPLLISRVKILANMNIAEHGHQEGKFSMRIRDKDIEMRVVTNLTTYGEIATLSLQQVEPWSNKQREILEGQLSKILVESQNSKT
jgi:type II secretory ATPase GspE/PulE/Tfp pilus assembly ATPase PilB-like protein